MSGEFDEAAFSKFRATPDRREAELHMMTTQQRIKEFLNARGVEFETEPAADEELIAQRLEDRGRLRMLATSVATFEAMHRARGELGEPSPLFKKKTQAKFLVAGYSGPWQEAIDQELPGEPLTDNDFELIAEAAIESVHQEQANEVIFDEKFSEIVTFLFNRGIVEFSRDEEDVLAQLTIISLIATLNNRPGLMLEEARSLITNNNLQHPAWLELVQYLLNR